MSGDQIPWQFPVAASLLPPTVAVALGLWRRIPRPFVAMTVVALENVGMAVLGEYGPNLHVGYVLVAVNLGLWIWAVAPWLDQAVLRQSALAAGLEMGAIWAATYADAMHQLAVAMPVQAMLLAAVGGAVLVNPHAKDAPGARSVGTFLCTYHGVTALAWPLGVDASPKALFWLFTMRALVHTAAYVRLAWELAQDADQRKAVTA